MKGNRLQHETSPYLLQHAHNPVDWYPWGDEALERAVKEDKPILVSIGYSACHWCHVMERESFEDDETARIMNEHFINIKIDREERPDLDHIYMEAVQMIAGNGGWPLNVFLTPDKKPFYGGTYFPPVRAFNRASWKEVLKGVSALFKDRRSEVEEQAKDLTGQITNANAYTKFSEGSDDLLLSGKDAREIFETIMKQADTQWGGFSHAPKFPQTFIINFLLRYHHYTSDRAALDHALLSLDKMIEGGIYDQLGGGFARYSTDREWLAPHFEKMLYDNALIIISLSDAYALTKRETYRMIVEETVGFIQRELMNEAGGFYSALDADSEGVEGKFYVWTYEEVKEILGEHAEEFCKYYDITPEGNWEGKSIPRRYLRGTSEAPPRHLRGELLEHRNRRVRPQLDDKVLLGWNALMIIALCKASAVFSVGEYRDLAIRNYRFIAQNLQDKNEPLNYYHTWKENKPKYPAFLEDYASLIHACIALQELTSDQEYLLHARELTEHVISKFKAPEGDFYFTSSDQKDVLLRKKEIYDGAVPSGNSSMAAALTYLGITFGENKFRELALQMLGNYRHIIAKYPTSFGNWLNLLMDLSVGFNEVVITGRQSGSLRDEFLKEYIPNKVFQSVDGTGFQADQFPLLDGRAGNGDPKIFVCRDYTCALPVCTVKEAQEQIVKKF